MKTFEIYEKALYKKYKIDALISKIEKDLCDIIKIDLEKEHLGNKTEIEGNIYDCRGVDIRIWSNYDETLVIENRKAQIELVFFLTNPTNKKHKDKIENAVKEFSETGRCPYDNSKIDLWLYMRYSVRIKDLLNNDYSLNIRGKLIN